MSSAAGPSIATSGLVLDIDMANTQKSWLGKPTTNLVITKVENYTGWGGAGWWMHPGNTTSVTSQTLPDGSTGLTLTATTLATGGLYGYNSYALGAAYVSGTQYTASFWAKSFGATASLNVRDADSGGTLNTGVSGITDSWKRFSFTWTANASTNMLTFTGSNFSLYNVQLETNSFATPFVAGTRSNIQAIVDLTSNTTLTATSLTYAADNTFSFNGSSSVATSPTITLNLTAGVSMEMVFKSTDIQSRTQGYMSFSPGPQYINFYSAGTGALRWETWLTAGSVGGAFYGPTNLTNNTWYHAVGTYASDGTAKLYINGVLVNSAAYAATSYGSLTSTIRIGEYAGYFSGTMPVSKIYTRALSASEVSQNFNATRARYGL